MELSAWLLNLAYMSAFCFVACSTYITINNIYIFFTLLRYYVIITSNCTHYLCDRYYLDY